MTNFQELTIQSTPSIDYQEALKAVFTSLGMNKEPASYKASQAYTKSSNRKYKHRIDARPNFGYATFNFRPDEFSDNFISLDDLTAQSDFLLDSDFQRVRIYHDEKTKCANVCFFAKDKTSFHRSKITLTLTDLRKLSALQKHEEAALPYLQVKDKRDLSKGDQKILLASKFKTLLNEIKKTASLEKKRGFKMQHKI